VNVLEADSYDEIFAHRLMRAGPFLSFSTKLIFAKNEPPFSVEDYHHISGPQDFITSGEIELKL